MGMRCIIEPTPSLMLAVLNRAKEDLSYSRSGSKEGQKIFLDALEWFTSEDLDYPLSFRSVCFTLKLDYEAVLTELARQFKIQHHIEARKENSHA